MTRRFLADHPVPLGLTGARARAAADLPSPERNLWRALSDQPMLWEVGGGPEAQPPVVVIEQAPRSQFAALLDVLKEGRELPDGSAAVALRGDQFKGLRERTWMALEGNLHLCVYHRPMTDIGRIGAGLTAVPAVAVVRTIRELYGDAVNAGIKWVNDVLVDGRKVSGVLSGAQLKEQRVEHVVFGVGINIAATPTLKRTPFVPAAGCLRELTDRPDVGLSDVLGSLLRHMDHGYRTLIQHGPAEVLDAYRSDSCVVGRRVQVWDASTDAFTDEAPIAVGVVASIEPDLSLRLVGRPDPVPSGRLVLDE